MNAGFKSRSLVLLACAAVTAAAVQDIMPAWGVYRLRPDFLMAVVMYYAVRRDVAACVAAALLCGIAADGLSQTAGGGMLWYGLAAAAGWFSRRQLPENAVSCALVCVPCCIVAGFAQWCCALCGWGYGVPGGGMVFAAVRIALNALISGAAALPVSAAMWVLDDACGNLERSTDEQFG